MKPNNIYLPGFALTTLQIKRANKYFPRAIEAGYFKRHPNGGYQWTMEFGRNSKFAYFINETLNPNGRYKLQRAKFERLFGLSFGDNTRNVQMVKEMKQIIFYD